MNILAVDCGGSSIKYSLIDEKGHRCNAGSVSAPIASTDAFVEAILGIYNPVKEDVDGVAFSLPGFINGTTGYVRAAGAYFPLYGQNIRELLSEHISVPISVENDGKCAAFAEAWIGSLSNVEEGAVVIIGTGIAGGLIHEGKLYRGYSGTAGEFSFTRLSPGLNLKDSSICRCGMAGLTLRTAAALGIDINKCPYKDYAAYLGITNDGFSALNDDKRFDNGIDGKLFFDLLDEGNAIVEGLYDDFIDDLCSMLMAIQAVADPEFIAIGGQVTRQERLIPDIEKRIKDYDKFMGGNSTPVIRVKKCGADAYPTEYGAVYNFLKENPQLRDK